VTGLWFAFAWWVLRPRIIRKEEAKLTGLIRQLEEIHHQLDNPESLP
jgi:hypothetical protein